ncbi:MAG TPA: DUF4232 domain-containing protein [Streptomyces sp.]|uniref:DUF4232 domain-containing protein n=1 Tax=Streptomyces sp. TaxID=1931 RepID=UPI002B99A102|nr:DUF4232 domain-containing protein [Streptomyces sp.]HWU10689.1 DUF4232 domain-containing protein [Streptomyces sp.]
MRDLRFRRAARTSVLGTAALIAALSLTACQSSDPAPAAYDAEAPASQKPAEDTSAAPAADTGTDTDTDKGTAGNTGTSGSGSGTAKDSGSTAQKPAAAKQQGSKDSSTSLPTCTDANTKLTVTSVPRPVNHMLLTVTNTGSKACYAYSYPFLKFGGAQSVPQVFEESKPQAVVTLSPGQSAYAGIRTSAADGSGTGGYSTKDLAVGFQDASAGSAGRMVSVPLGKETYVDSTLAVTYWQTGMEDALMY